MGGRRSDLEISSTSGLCFVSDIHGAVPDFPSVTSPSLEQLRAKSPKFSNPASLTKPGRLTSIKSLTRERWGGGSSGS